MHSWVKCGTCHGGVDSVDLFVVIHFGIDYLLTCCKLIFKEEVGNHVVAYARLACIVQLLFVFFTC